MDKNRRTSFLIIKDDKIYSEDEFRMPERTTKSILKPCTLRRSMSMESRDRNAKKVAFSDPKCIVDVNFIDEKMKKSCIDVNGYRRRSFTVPNNTNYFSQKIPVRTVPNFKAIHEQEFNRMESLTEHAQRKAERAKMLLKPSTSLTTKKPSPENIKVEKSNFVRNSETRTPITSRSLIKRPAIIPFVGPPSKIPKISLPHNEVEKKRASLNSVNFLKKDSPIARIISKITGTDRKSIAPSQERTQLKGVRLNKRFELQMQHQKIQPSVNQQQHSRS